MTRTFVIPDIHGCLRTLRELIETRIGVNQTDTLIFLGDYIDRGNFSKEVVDYIISLEKNGYPVVRLCGNHEEALLDAYHADFNLKKSLFRKEKNTALEAWLSFGGKDAMKSYGTEDIKQLPTEHIEWYKSLKFWHETDKFLIAHAGFNFQAEDIFEDTKSMMWIRDFDVDLTKTGNRKVIHGHVPVSLDLIHQTIDTDSFKFIDLDNGCVYADRNGMGNLLALELGSMQLTVQKNIEKQ